MAVSRDRISLRQLGPGDADVARALAGHRVPAGYWPLFELVEKPIELMRCTDGVNYLRRMLEVELWHLRTEL